jgi:hypothetical protein
MLRTELVAEASSAAILDRSRLGIAIAAMIRMIATTIRSSIREKPALCPSAPEFFLLELIFGLYVAFQRPVSLWFGLRVFPAFRAISTGYGTDQRPARSI